MNKERINKLIVEALQKPQNKSCSCGCGKCSSNQGPMLTEGKVKNLLSEGLQYHIDNKLPLHETIYRFGSDKHLALVKEAKKLYSRGVIDVITEDKQLLETNLGEFALYEGVEVPLDLPMVNEDLARGYKWKASKATQDRKDKGYDFNDLLAIKSDLKDKGFDVKIGYPTEIDPKLQIQASFEDIENGLESILNQMFDYDYRIVFDTNQKMFESISEAKKKEKKDPPIGKPKRGGSKAYYVYVRDPKTKKVKKVSFGSGGLRAKIKNKEARNAFAKRHKCATKKDRTKASYWSCNLPRYAPALGLGAKMNTYW